MASIYTERHSGVAIYCGSAPCVFSDLEEAKKLFPNAPIYGANYTASMIPGIEHVWTQHDDIAQSIKDDAGKKIFVHTRFCQSMGPDGLWKQKHQRRVYDAVDYVWPDLDWVSGSSGVAGAYWLRHGMGYDQVIICGAPLDEDCLEYADQYAGSLKKRERQCAKKQNMQQWLSALKRNVGPRTANIYSMSGATRRILGGPDGIR
jgi:hypothetical protein